MVRLMAAITGLGVEMCLCTHLHLYILLALNLLTLPFPGGCVARLRPPGREKVEEVMAIITLEAPGQSRVELEEATR